MEVGTVSTETDLGRVPDGTRLSSPTEPLSAQALGPSGFDPSRGPWLIWSDYHGAWHRRSVDDDGHEHAAGYTCDILDAGIFGKKVARNYHDDGRNVAMPLRSMALNVKAKALGLEQKLEVARALIRACDSDGSPKGGDGEAGSVRSTTARAEGIAR